jgi:hypothetical protein
MTRPRTGSSLTPGRAARLRAGAVVLGPSLFIDIVIAGCTAAMVRRWLPRRRGARSERPLTRGLLAMGALAPWVYAAGVRPWLVRWGATDEEVRRGLPGDDLVPQAAAQSTRAVTIHAPAAEVWKWLVQIGQGRGGFYSYDWLENLAGIEIHSTDRIEPAWQSLAVGHFVRAAPVQTMPDAGWTVAVLEPERALVLRGWGAFVLDPVDDHTTRLIARSRMPGRPALLAALRNAMTWELPHFIMERKMLLGIKARAERAQRSLVDTARATVPPPAAPAASRRMRTSMTPVVPR